MKRKFIIILVLQTCLILFLLMYASIQKTEADVQRELAEQQRRNAEGLEKRIIETEIKYKKLLEETSN